MIFYRLLYLFLQRLTHFIFGTLIKLLQITIVVPERETDFGNRKRDIERKVDFKGVFSITRSLCQFSMHVNETGSIEIRMSWKILVNILKV